MLGVSHISGGGRLPIWRNPFQKGVVSTGGGGSDFVPEFQAVYDAWTIKPSDADALIWNTMVESMVTSGEWAKLDRWFFFAIHTNDNGEALIDWINPTRTATAVNSPVFTAYEGFTGDGSSSYIDTNYNPTTDAVNYTADSASYGVYDRFFSTEDKGVQLSAGLNSSAYLNYQQSPSFNSNLVRINDDVKYMWTGGDTAAIGMNIIFRSSNTIYGIDVNGNIDNKNELSSTILPNENFLILYYPATSLFSSDQISMVFMSGLFNEVERTNVRNAVETALSAKGKGVIV